MTSIFDHTIESLVEIVRTHSEADIERDCTLEGRLQLAADGPLMVSWAPFEHIRSSARVVIVGITPGRSQATRAILSLRRILNEGGSLPEALEHAKDIGSFAGPMRLNLAAMLDHIGMHRVLGIQSCGTLFDDRRDLVHYTSALRYPVFVAGSNYSGTPGLERVPLLAGMVDDILSKEADELGAAIWIPIGPVPAAALERLVRSGRLASGSVLAGLPHASGANAERIAYFLGRKSAEALSSKTNAFALDERRRTLLEKVSRLKAG